MNASEIITLLSAAMTNLEQYEDRQKKTGADFNIFEVTGISQKEVATCAFLAALLRPNETHGLGILPLKLFCQTVLGMAQFSDSDYEKAKVETEVPIDADRRIDILIKIHHCFIPIEVKIYAGDQPHQCVDYYQYALKYDPNAVLFYLTLDGHEPSTDSKCNLVIGQQFMCISFEKEILNWFSALLCEEKVQELENTRVILGQYKHVAERLTNHQAMEVTDIMKDLISSKDAFHAANAIEKSLPEIKADLMCKFFTALKDCLCCYEADFPLAFEGFQEQAKQYYSQNRSTWPSLNYSLPPITKETNRSFVLRIEIDHNLYYGVCNWDDSTKTTPQGTPDDVRESIIRASGSVEHKKKTAAFYWWEYLDEKNGLIDFRHCNICYENLYDKVLFQATVDRISREIGDFFRTWLANACR